MKLRILRNPSVLEDQMASIGFVRFGTFDSWTIARLLWNTRVQIKIRREELCQAIAFLVRNRHYKSIHKN